MDKIPVSHRGAEVSYTEFGPPESTIPTGSNLRICSIPAVQGRIALNTCCSRIRRAINCVYCPPKSSTTMPPRSLIHSPRGRIFSDVLMLVQLQFFPALARLEFQTPNISNLKIKFEISSIHAAHGLPSEKRLQVRQRHFQDSQQRLPAVERIMRREHDIVACQELAIAQRRPLALHVEGLLYQ